MGRGVGAIATEGGAVGDGVAEGSGGVAAVGAGEPLPEGAGVAVGDAVGAHEAQARARSCQPPHPWLRYPLRRYRAMAGRRRSRAARSRFPQRRLRSCSRMGKGAERRA